MKNRPGSRALGLMAVLTAIMLDTSSSKAAEADRKDRMIAALQAQISELKQSLTQLQGSVVSQWVDFTPLVKSGGSSGFIISGKYRRVGSDIEIWLNISGNPLASLGPKEMYVSYLPPGVTVDLDKAFDHGSRNGGFAYGTAFVGETGGYAAATFELDAENPSRGRPLIGNRSLRLDSPNLPGYSPAAFKNISEFVSVRISLPVLQWSGLAIDLPR
jgi:hypothetical protein